MSRVVEDAGGELSAGYLFKLVRFGEQCHGSLTLAGRDLRWEWAPAGVAVSHPAADPAAGTLAYLVPTDTTVLPSGGLRRWWACPLCGRRSDSLYLPAGQERLACRRCCGLTYRSQQAAGPVLARKERPGLWSERTVERWEGCRVTGLPRLVYRRHVRRRL